MMLNSQRWLIAADLDGTLFDHSLQILPRVRDAIAAAQALGHIVTLATGRMHRATEPFAVELALSNPLICYQGALIRQAHEIWLHQPLPLAIAHEAVRVARERGFHLNVYVDDVLYIEQVTPQLKVYTDLSPMAEPRVIGDLQTFLTREPTKMLFICDKSETPEFLSWAEAQWGTVAQVVQSHAQFVELTHPAASKGSAVMFLAERLGVPRERVLAVGDHHNDISMITMAGVGVAMGNASPAIQSHADWVAPPVSEAGLAAAIEKFVLGTI